MRQTLSFRAVRLVLVDTSRVASTSVGSCTETDVASDHAHPSRTITTLDLHKRTEMVVAESAFDQLVILHISWAIVLLVDVMRQTLSLRAMRLVPVFSSRVASTFVGMCTETYVWV